MTKIDATPSNGNGRKKRKREWLFATVPEDWVRPEPAIRHWHEDDRLRLSPFEMAVALGCINLARAAHGEVEHNAAIEAGQKKISAEKLKYHGKGDALKAKVKRAGAEGYRIRRDKPQPPPNVLTIKTSRRALLAAADLPNNGRNQSQISAALDRLTRTVMNEHPPLLTEWRDEQPLILKVKGVFLLPQFISVPLPLPQLPATLALFLFLYSVDTRTSHSRTIDIFKLVKILGIGRRWDNWKRDLDRAITTLNTYLQEYDDERARTLNKKYGINVPEYFNVANEVGYLRFTASQRWHRWQNEDERREDDDADDDAAEIETPTVSDERHQQDDERRREANEDNRNRWFYLFDATDYDPDYDYPTSEAYENYKRRNS
jgi:hypothetical protein